MSKLVGLVGWRGMVGSVLMDRMVQEKDFYLIEPLFFSTSNAGGKAPAQARNETTLQDAFNIDQLARCEIIITAQGGDYTNEVYPKLRAAGWNGHWIDAASSLRMEKNAVIVLDPVNMPVIKNALANGGKDWIGGNCTVSCMLMGVGALYKAGRVRRRCTAHARTAHAVRHAERRSEGPARRPQERHPRNRPDGLCQAAQPHRTGDRQLRRPPFPS